ncbi:hypothetical protein [Oryzibacter oryziterrae]|uniref:hypothetical protein n=1 Tax=Oryzibacter oryziterrae TaxID=2766474 RepID=UPI001F27DBD1|nr:hypothetical protein [Oryzibacter oryziterrae]
MKTMVSLMVAAAVGVLSAGAANACDALNGTTTYDSVSNITGDPLQGGNWSNAANGGAWMQRVLNKPASIFGVYLGLAGTDITTVGSRIKISMRQTNGAWKTIVDLREADIVRPITGQGTIMDPLTIRFPPITVTTVRVDMSGHGWFAFDKTMFFVSGCTVR